MFGHLVIGPFVYIHIELRSLFVHTQYRYYLDRYHNCLRRFKCNENSFENRSGPTRIICINSVLLVKVFFILTVSVNVEIVWTNRVGK